MRDLEFNINGKDRTAPAFDSAEARAKKFNGQLDKASSGFNLAGMAARSFAAAFSISAVAGFARMVQGVIKDGADLVDLANKVGIATGDIQRLQYGFQLAGVAAGDVDQILTQWSKRIGEAYTQGGKLAEILKANGVSLTDAEGRLRSSVDLMRDYADLIANAGSDQERMTLALQGFGKAGDEMVLALRDGASGFDKLMAQADEAGGVLDEALLQKAAEIDDAFDKMWHNFAINSKSAILTAVGAVDDMLSILRQGQERRNIDELASRIGDFQKYPLVAVKGDRMDSDLERRFEDAFSGATQENDKLVRMLRDRFGTHTVIPGDPADRKAATSAAKEQESAYQKVIEKLQQEQAQIGLTATEQKVMNELRRAGVTLGTAEGQSIAALVVEMEKQRAAQASLAENTEYLKSTTASFITTFRQDMQAGESALTSFSNAFSSMVDTLATKVEERFAGNLIDKLLGSTTGGGAGLLSFLFGGAAAGGGFTPNTTYGKFIGAYAGGTDSAPGGWSLVGERGPELMNVPRGARILPADKTADVLGGGPPTIIHFNVSTPDVEGFRRSESQIAARLNRVMARGSRNN